MWLRSLLFEHFWLKLFSLLLAILVWLAVWANSGRDLGSREFDARDVTTNLTSQPILIMTESGAHPPLNVEPPLVDIAVRGSHSQVSKLEANEVRAFVRMSERGDFDGAVPVHVQLPREIVLVMVSPASVRVKTVNNHEQPKGN